MKRGFDGPEAGFMARGAGEYEGFNNRGDRGCGGRRPRVGGIQPSRDTGARERGIERPIPEGRV